MNIETGEYLVGAYLSEILGCIVSYNIKSEETGVAGFSEIDVIGINMSEKIIYCCEVKIRLDGLQDKSNGKSNIVKITQQLESIHKIAENKFPGFNIIIQLWCNKISEGKVKAIQNQLNNLDVQFIVNDIFFGKLDELRTKAKTVKKNTGNSFFKALQIIEQKPLWQKVKKHPK